mmetsp:Transcript_62686/g.149546  ORF Transcript_62686/g.149546 Transcript_62686/m.149546 type:complete len:643 (+) Transcript_62686:24-1952(+)
MKVPALVVAVATLCWSELSPAWATTTNSSSTVPPCAVGAPVVCSDGTHCAGAQCCADGTVCPSAPAAFDGCPQPKTWDCTSGGGGRTPWYAGIASILVFGPGDDVAGKARGLYQGDMDRQQFSDQRYALLLKAGTYTGDIPVGYFTQLMGVGTGAADTTVESFSTLDNPLTGNACDNFWRAVEGVTTTTKQRVYWAASQAAPLRRIEVQGELWLSEEGAPHWSSGGFMADSVIHGALQMGTQQQYFVRNSYMDSGAEGRNKNYVFLGSVGDPGSSNDGTVTSVPSTPKVRSKPFLSELAGSWSIKVPTAAQNVRGLPPASSVSIAMAEVYVAREGDNAASINAGIAGKKGLLFTPGIYGFEAPVQISKADFVVLGIGFPTLLALKGNSALEILADGVSVSSILLEAATPKTFGSTDPLLLWAGNDGYGFDIFSRVGAFHYSRSFKPSCLLTRADTHVEVSGSRVTLDNVWLWHADHDDCGGHSDQCLSNYGLVVTGTDVIVYGLKVEHMFNHLVLWGGERGQVYFFQSELPYHAAQYPGTGAYAVDQAVAAHKAVGLGVYMVGTPYVVDTAFRVPPSADMTNMFTWAINGKNTQFRSVVCTSASGLGGCLTGDRCDEKSCYVYELTDDTAKLPLADLTSISV